MKWKIQQEKEERPIGTAVVFCNRFLWMTYVRAGFRMRWTRPSTPEVPSSRQTEAEPSRTAESETGRNMSTNIRYKSRLMKSGNDTDTGTVFTLFLLWVSGWNDDYFSLPACASSSSRTCFPHPTCCRRFRGQWGEKQATLPHRAVFTVPTNSWYKPPSFPHKLNRVTKSYDGQSQSDSVLYIGYCCFLMCSRERFLRLCCRCHNPSTDARHSFRIIITHISCILLLIRKSDVCWLFWVVDMRMIVLLLSGGVVMVTGAGGWGCWALDVWVKECISVGVLMCIVVSDLVHP